MSLSLLVDRTIAGAYCRANQEWQWCNILFNNINLSLHFNQRESTDHVCINHKQSMMSLSLLVGRTIAGV